MLINSAIVHITSIANIEIEICSHTSTNSTNGNQQFECRIFLEITNTYNVAYTTIHDEQTREEKKNNKKRQIEYKF